MRAITLFIGIKMSPESQPDKTKQPLTRPRAGEGMPDDEGAGQLNRGNDLLEACIAGMGFTVLYLLEAVMFVGGGIHGPSFFVPLGFVLGTFCPVRIWLMLLTRPPTKPFGAVIGAGLVMAVVPGIAYVILLMVG